MLDNDNADGPRPIPDCGSATGDPTMGDIVLSAGSTANTVADYNLLFEHDAVEQSGPTQPLYNWAGTAYLDPSDLIAATGQGQHDLNADPGISWSEPTAVVINSADADAPGELSTDVYGYPRVDDPLVPNTGAGPAGYDRGAIQIRDPLNYDVVASTTKGPFPLPFTASVNLIANPWSDTLTYTFDFGDGTAPVTTSNPSATHTYPTPSPAGSQGYHLIVTVSVSNGLVGQDPSHYVQVVAPAPLVPSFTVAAQLNTAGAVEADSSASTDSWEITNYVFNWGDGTPPSVAYTHNYTTGGPHLITLTETDAGGRSASVSTTYVVPASRKLPNPVSGGGRCGVCY